MKPNSITLIIQLTEPFYYRSVLRNATDADKSVLRAWRKMAGKERAKRLHAGPWYSIRRDVSLISMFFFSLDILARFETLDDRRALFATLKLFANELTTSELKNQKLAMIASFRKKITLGDLHGVFYPVMGKGDWDNFRSLVFKDLGN